MRLLANTIHSKGVNQAAKLPFLTPSSQLMSSSIATNIAELQQRIGAAKEKFSGAAKDISLMAVSKTRPAQTIREAYAAGLDQFGENYLQEALDKMEALTELPLTWHFIGPIQSNKTRAIAESFDWVHSVDRLKIAQRLNNQRPENKPALNICLQININNETSKSGIHLGELPLLAEHIAQLPKLCLRGLMGIPEASEDFQQQRANFAQLRQAFKALQSTYPQLDTLSMGMSRDMEAAIAEGSTILRIGTDIFGARNPV
jgi:pyridoxal phosphate enzyme (YggS family)